MKATVVSTLPFKLTEDKPGLIPPYYEIPPAEFGKVSILVVNDGYHSMLIPGTDEKTPPIKIPDPALTIANSLINDYVSANIEIDYGMGALPGLFAVDGEYSIKQITSIFSRQVEVALQQTYKWFERLVMRADDDWAKTHQHKSISEIQRAACNFLQFKNKEWNFNVVEMLQYLCWACKVQVHPEAIICSSCKAILNQVEFDKRKNSFSIQ